ncbi:MAG: hypothetical protein WCA39_02550, partial [Nitrososphaeraceae archaeon]
QLPIIQDLRVFLFEVFMDKCHTKVSYFGFILNTSWANTYVSDFVKYGKIFFIGNLFYKMLSMNSYPIIFGIRRAPH